MPTENVSYDNKGKGANSIRRVIAWLNPISRASEVVKELKNEDRAMAARVARALGHLAFGTKSDSDGET